jgi:hypothetical protein
MIWLKKCRFANDDDHYDDFLRVCIMLRVLTKGMGLPSLQQI